MYAVTIVEGALEWRSRPDPEPGPTDLLVRAHAAGLCRADLLHRDGLYPPPPGTTPPELPGMEFAGTVEAAGDGCRRFRPGDRVMAVVTGAAQAELAVVPEVLAMPVPDGVPWERAGGFPENYTTAHDALFTQCGLALGERVLVHGGAGGVGTAAIELAVAAGCSVVATVRDPSKRAGVAALGATAVAPDAFVDAGPFDVVLELVGGANMGDNLKALATAGASRSSAWAPAPRPRSTCWHSWPCAAASTARPSGPARWRTRRPPPAGSSVMSCRCSP